MIYRLFLWGLLLTFLNGSETDQDSLQNGLEYYRYKTVIFHLIQYQYGQTYGEEIEISFIDTNTYLIKTPQQEIFISGTLIKTHNKQTDQLIIDERLEGHEDIFSLLNGEIDKLKIKNKRSENGMITLDISMDEINISGTITIKANSWYFDSLKLDYDKENWIQINEKSWQILRGVYSYEKFGLNNNEVIDLRE